MAGEIDTEYTSVPTCPWCGHNHDPCWEYGSRECVDTECHSCGKPILMIRHISVSYSVRKIGPAS